MRKITALLAGLALAMVALPAAMALGDDTPQRDRVGGQRTIVKTFTENGEDVKRTITKRGGTNAITVLTLPTRVVGLTATVAPGTINVNWQAPQNTAGQAKANATITNLKVG